MTRDSPPLKLTARRSAAFLSAQIAGPSESAARCAKTQALSWILAWVFQAARRCFITVATLTELPSVSQP